MRAIDTVLFDLDDTLHDDTAAFRSATRSVATMVGVLDPHDRNPFPPCLFDKVADVRDDGAAFVGILDDAFCTSTTRSAVRASGALGEQCQTEAPGECISSDNASRPFFRQAAPPLLAGPSELGDAAAELVECAGQ